MSLSLKDIFNRKKVIPINQEFKIGEIVAYFGGSPDYELMAYARII